MPSVHRIHPFEYAQASYWMFSYYPVQRLPSSLVRRPCMFTQLSPRDGDLWWWAPFATKPATYVGKVGILSGIIDERSEIFDDYIDARAGKLFNVADSINMSRPMTFIEVGDSISKEMAPVVVTKVIVDLTFADIPSRLYSRFAAATVPHLPLRSLPERR